MQVSQKVIRGCLQVQKYDVLSAMMGSLVVTTYFVARGQDPIQALTLTAASTVMALVRSTFFHTCSAEFTSIFMT